MDKYNFIRLCTSKLLEMGEKDGTPLQLTYYLFDGESHWTTVFQRGIPDYYFPIEKFDEGQILGHGLAHSFAKNEILVGRQTVPSDVCKNPYLPEMGIIGIHEKGKMHDLALLVLSDFRSVVQVGTKKRLTDASRLVGKTLDEALPEIYDFYKPLAFHEE